MQHIRLKTNGRRRTATEERLKTVSGKKCSVCVGVWRAGLQPVSLAQNLTLSSDSNRYSVRIGVICLVSETCIIIYPLQGLIYIRNLLVLLYVSASLRQIRLSLLFISVTNELAEVTRPSPKTAYIRYSPTPEQQKMISSKGVTGLFKVQYDVQRSLDAGDIYVRLKGMGTLSGMATFHLFLFKLGLSHFWKGSTLN